MSNFIIIVLSAAIIYLLLRVRSLENTLRSHISHVRHHCVTSEDMYAALLKHENVLMKSENDDDGADDGSDHGSDDEGASATKSN